MYTYPPAASPICFFTDGSDGNYPAPATKGSLVRPPGPRSSSHKPVQPRRDSDLPDSSAGGRRKSTGQKKKGKGAAAAEEEEDPLIENVPTENTGLLTIKAWRKLRESNPYRFEV